MESQKQLREAIEKAETKKMEENWKKINNMAKINPKMIWEARKWAKGSNRLVYNTMTE